MDLQSYLLGKKSGGGGTSDYSQLSNKPSINGVTLAGNKTDEDLGMMSIKLLTSQEFDLLGMKKGIYVVDPTKIRYKNVSIYYSPYRTGSYTYGTSLTFGTLYILKDITNNMQVGEEIGMYITVSSGKLYSYILKIRGDSAGVTSDSDNGFVYIDSSTQDITGTKTFYSIPKQSSTAAPTLDTQFTNKKYVDDSIATAITGALEGEY